MKYPTLPAILSLFLCLNLTGQKSPTDMPSEYFAAIPDYPDTVTASTVFLRMVEGLGYRYHWASKDLRPEDLTWRPSEDGKSTLETIEHVMELTRMVRNAVEGRPNMRPVPEESLDYQAMRAAALENLAVVSKHLRANDEEKITDYQVVYQRGDTRKDFPFWHVINGPLSDAIYHTGQIVAYRRASGNPIDARVSVFMGRNR